MKYSEVAPIPKRMTIVAGLSVVGLMAFGLALSYYKNVLFDRQLIALQDRNIELKNEILDGYKELQYLESAQYRDKYSKENFGLIQPGEKVLLLGGVLGGTPAQALGGSDPTPEEIQARYEETLRSIRILDHWRLYLFNRDKIDDLKKAL